MATVTLGSKDETADRCITITKKSFRTWKRRHGRNAGIVVHIPRADGDGEILHVVRTFSDMCKLPAGSYQGQLAHRCKMPDAAGLHGADLWKCI